MFFGKRFRDIHGTSMQKNKGSLFFLLNLGSTVQFSVQQRCPLSSSLIDSPGTDASQASACICNKGEQAVDHVTIWQEVRCLKTEKLKHAFILCMSGQELKQLLQLAAVLKVLNCFLWHDAECHLALRIAFQPKGSKHHIPAAHLYFYTNRRNSRCYHGVPSERWQWAFYRDQWDSYIIPHCDLFLRFFCALETRWSICDCGVL